MSVIHLVSEKMDQVGSGSDSGDQVTPINSNPLGLHPTSASLLRIDHTKRVQGANEAIQYDSGGCRETVPETMHGATTL